MEDKSLIRELRPHAVWDVVKEGIKLMVPFLAGFGVKQWATDHATALMWTFAVLAAVGIAFIDRFVPKRSPPGGPAASGPPPLGIVNVWNGDAVAYQQEIYGVSAVNRPGQLPIELRVFAGGFWHRQWAVAAEGSKWHCKCQFGNTETTGGSSYQLVAIRPKSPLPDKITELPADVEKSEIVSVIRSTPAIIPKVQIAPSSPQGGMALFGSTLVPPDRVEWSHFSLSVANTDPSASLCDLIVTLELEEEGGGKSVRHVERAVFKTPVMNFPSKMCCLEAGQIVECVIAIWSKSVGVQTLRSWAGGMPSMPLGESLYPGVWWCNVAVKAQGVEQHARYRFKVAENSMSRFMLPPGTLGETG